MFIFSRSPLKVYLHGHFHVVVVVQRRQRNVQKSVMHVQSRSFANVNLLLCCRFYRWRRRRRCLSYLLGTLRSNDADGNKNVKKKNRFYKQNNNFARASRFFVHFFACFCTTTTEKCRKQATTKLNFSFCTRIWSLGIQLQEGSPTYEGRKKRAGIIAIKTERKQIHF